MSNFLNRTPINVTIISIDVLINFCQQSKTNKLANKTLKTGNTEDFYSECEWKTTSFDLLYCIYQSIQNDRWNSIDFIDVYTCNLNQTFKWWYMYRNKLWMLKWQKKRKVFFVRLNNATIKSFITHFIYFIRSISLQCY